VPLIKSLNIHKGKYASVRSGFPRLSPSACGALALAIDDAIAVFDEWGLPRSARLLQAKKLLLRVNVTQSYGTTAQQLKETANAIIVANDFYLISRTMKGGRADPVASELKGSMGGKLFRNKGNKQTPFDIQSQFWFGTVLAHSGLHPAVIDSQDTRPDFAITVGTLSCGVELKRPHSDKAAWRNISTAASQLRTFGKPGIIVLDLSACVGVDELIVHGGPRTTRQTVDHRFYRLVDQLNARVERYRHSDKFQRVMMIVMYARFFSWVLDGDTDVDSGFFFKTNIQPDAWAGLITDYSRRLERSLLRGFEIISGNRLRTRRTWH
jgi:hypothetical protein